MRLRNKKTGEIGTTDTIIPGFNSIKQLNEEWEDYEEPECYWCINDLNGEPFQVECSHYAGGEEYYEKSIEMRKQIGNYFETKEEAEKAVEKLKAWKRLKDKGFEFTSWKGDEIEFVNECPNEVKDIEEFESDLDLLFGGEE